MESQASEMTMRRWCTGLFAAALALPLGAAPWSEKQAEELRGKIREAWHVPSPLPELSAEAHGQFEVEPGVVAERVSYATQYGLRVPAILYRPSEVRGRAPALIVVNGHGGDKFSWYAFYSGVAYARLGAVVLTYDPAGEGERNSARKSGTRAHDKVDPTLDFGPRLGGLMMTDVMQAVSYLQSRADVDAKRIGAVGYSMGSFILSITGAAEPRLKAVVLAGGGNLDGPDGYWDKSKPLCQGQPYRALAFLGDRPAAIYALHAMRGPTLLFNGHEDTTVSIPQVGEPAMRAVRAQVVAQRGGEAGVFEAEFVGGSGHRPYFVTKPVALWLEKQIDFPRVTPSEIEALPETHIAVWARERGVEMDPLYAIEHREGGTRALGRDVPAVTRQQLCVLSPEEWERRKASFVHESWLRETRTRLAASGATKAGRN